ncbi:MAG: YggT family protein [Betaproteobacteria bacterium]|nr:YggT family protein [Betaproteobacteria bacterium]
MLSGALIFLVNTVFGLFTVALLLRFYLQWARASYRNPVSEFLGALTDFMVRPARRVIPGWWGLDLASLVLAWLAQMLELIIVMQIRGYTVMVAVIVQAVLTWFNPYSPLMPLLNGMTRPFLRVFQRLVPPVGNVDLSPLFVIVVIQLLLMLPVAYLEVSVARLFT